MSHDWQPISTIVTIDSPWLRLLAERWRDGAGQLLDYWRVEKADSVIALPRWRGQLVVPPPQFRPGLGRATVDLPGGRVPDGVTPVAAVPRIVARELGLADGALTSVTPLNAQGWPVNSSFSNQCLFGVVVDVADSAEIPPSFQHIVVPDSADGVRTLLDAISCLQCRAVLAEYLHQNVPAG